MIFLLFQHSDLRGVFKTQTGAYHYAVNRLVVYRDRAGQSYVPFTIVRWNTKTQRGSTKYYKIILD